jgi:hypothetical protein
MILDNLTIVGFIVAIASAAVFILADEWSSRERN